MGIFENWVGFLNFLKFFSILWLGWVPFGVCASVLAPCGSLNLYWGIFHHVHAFFIVFIICCMLGVRQNVQVTFFSCIELKWVSLLEFSLFDLVSHALVVFNSLCSQMPCLAHTVYTLASLGTPHAPPVAHTSIHKCTAYAHSDTFFCFHALCV